MAAPTWATDPIGTALHLLGKDGLTLARLNQIANRDPNVALNTAIAATDVTHDGTSIGILDRTSFPDAPFFGRIFYRSTEDVKWAATTLYAAGKVRVPTTGADGLHYEATTGGCKSNGVEPVWPTAVGGTVKEGSLAAKWAAATVTALGDEVLPAYADWAADTVTALNTHVFPTTPNGYVYKATSRTGNYKTAPVTEPVWPTVVGATIVDNKVTWTCEAPLVAVATARGGDFKTADAVEPTWPAIGEEVVDDAVTWTMRQIKWTAYPTVSEIVKVTVVTPGGGTTATLTVTRAARGLPMGGGSLLVGTPVETCHSASSIFSVLGRYYTAVAVGGFLHYTKGEADALGAALNRYFGISKVYGKRIFEMAKAKNKELTFTTLE